MMYACLNSQKISQLWLILKINLKRISNNIILFVFILEKSQECVILNI